MPWGAARFTAKPARGRRRVVAVRRRKAAPAKRFVVLVDTTKLRRVPVSRPALLAQAQRSLRAYHKGVKVKGAPVVRAYLVLESAQGQTNVPVPQARPTLRLVRKAGKAVVRSKAKASHAGARAGASSAERGGETFSQDSQEDDGDDDGASPSDSESEDAGPDDPGESSEDSGSESEGDDGGDEGDEGGEGESDEGEGEDVGALVDLKNVDPGRAIILGWVIFGVTASAAMAIGFTVGRSHARR